MILHNYIDNKFCLDPNNKNSFKEIKYKTKKKNNTTSKFHQKKFEKLKERIKNLIS